VLLVARRAHRSWGRAATAAHVVFGVSMLLVAAFSTRSWQAGASFGETEDALHSVFATLMGFAFAAGVAIVLVRRDRASSRRAVVDALALGAAVVLPLGMTAFGEADGLLQRAMLLVAYAWYGREGLALHGKRARWVAGSSVRAQLGSRAADPGLGHDLDELTGRTLDEL